MKGDFKRLCDLTTADVDVGKIQNPKLKAIVESALEGTKFMDHGDHSERIHSDHHIGQGVGPGSKFHSDEYSKDHLDAPCVGHTDYTEHTDN